MTFRNTLKLGHLHTFVAIADSGGFARLGTKPNLDPVRGLASDRGIDPELGVALFDRSSQHIKLTSEGEDSAQAQSPAGRDADSLGERARALKGGQGWKVACQHYSAGDRKPCRTLPRALLAPSHPGVEVEIVEIGVARYSQLERGDIGLTMITSGDDQRFHRRLLYPIYVWAVFSQKHRFGRRAVLDPVELAEEPLLLPKHGRTSGSMRRAMLTTSIHRSC